MMITAYSEFAGFGGDSQGIEAIPGVELVFASNHKQLAVDVHELNFPHARHLCRDVTRESKNDPARFPRVDFAWHSPSCPAWFASGQGFRPGFRTTPGISQRAEVKGYGNAVPPPMAEVIGSPLIEAITGQPLERAR